MPKLSNLYCSGETIGNSDRILYPPNDDILNETGKIQVCNEYGFLKLMTLDINTQCSK
jgi:hypothetical protein